MLRRFILSLNSDDSKERFNSVKYVSDYIGMIVRIGFLWLCISSVYNIDAWADPYLVPFAPLKFLIVAYLAIVLIIFSISFHSLTLHLCQVAIDSVLPPQSPDGPKKLILMRYSTNLLFGVLMLGVNPGIGFIAFAISARK